MNYATVPHADVLMDRFGYKVAGRLASTQNQLPYDISERLRASRMQALARRKTSASVQTAQAISHHGGAAALTWGQSEGPGLWSGLGSVFPIIALVICMMFIQSMQDERRVSELADVDTALLADDLPPQAYTDAGFAQFLKHHQ